VVDANADYTKLTWREAMTVGWSDSPCVVLYPSIKKPIDRPFLRIADKDPIWGFDYFNLAVES